ncbi:CHAT domain-containing protein [Sphaerothrix gracilis]|uniref:CHAT domain-containing protein n=1 Tax=Sphaerothrix gracilis TaxID=3151835 RepID=UPI0031FDDB77
MKPRSDSPAFSQKRQWRRWRRHPLALASLLLLTLIFSVSGLPTAGLLGLTQVPAAIAQTPQTAQQLEQQAKTAYSAGDFATAAAQFQQAAIAYGQSGNLPHQMMALSNASLAYQQLGDWPAATQSVQQAVALVESLPGDRQTVDWLAAAQTSNAQGRLAFSRGQAAEAAAAWEQAVSAYEQADELALVRQSQLNQAQALQTGGFYLRAVEILTQLVEATSTPDRTQLLALRSLGDALRLTGELDQSRETLQQALALTQQLALPDETSAIHLSLGNLTRLSSDAAAATEQIDASYQQAWAIAQAPLSQLQVRLAQVGWLIDQEQWYQAYTLWPEMWALQEALSPGRAALYARIDLSRHLNELRRITMLTLSTDPEPAPFWAVLDEELPAPRQIADLLREAYQMARSLSDPAAEAYVLGTLAEVYEQTEQWAFAADLTQQALAIAQSHNIGGITYRLQAQLGRIQLNQDDKSGAIAALSAAVETLQSVRGDLVAVSSEAQFSFQKSVEPIYRDLVKLLLTAETPANGEKDNLKQARKVLEYLQLAELDNFFREACLNAESVEIDQLDPKAAVIYSVLLDDRIATIVSFPDGRFQTYSEMVERSGVQATLDELYAAIKNKFSKQPEGTRGNNRGDIDVIGPNSGAAAASEREIGPAAQQLYQWMIKPLEADLEASDTQTLVFVLDGELQQVPMSVLYDEANQKYLIEKYAIALTPGLNLLESKPIEHKAASVIVAGLTQERPIFPEFPALPFVGDEVEAIQKQLPSQVLLDEDFNISRFETAVGTSPSPIIHLATHGQFGSSAEDTFILTWDDKLNVNRFSNLLLTSELSREGSIDLLVLSACQTAAGDARATLGLAGVAMRSGARSTLATLWQIDDEATSELMTNFYQTLGEAELSKAETLRQAQLKMLERSERAHPYYWAPFVLIGNWL